MPEKRENQDKTGASRERLDDLVHEAMLRMGWAFPSSPEDVARAEAEIAECEEPLPPGLSDPYALFDAAKRPRLRGPCAPANDDVVEYLARAAREGKAITVEVEAAMRADRERAERETDEK